MFSTEHKIPLYFENCLADALLFDQSISNQSKKPVDEIRVSEPAMKRPPRQKKPGLLRFLVGFFLLTLPPQAGCLRNLLTKLLVSA
jgi:hypothetical protein